HIEREDGNATCERLAVIRRILVEEPAVARRIGEQDPSRAACERLAHRYVFTSPALKGAEIASQRLCKRVDGRPGASKAREVQLVQQRRIERDKLLLLEPADHITRRRREIERRELFADGVQAS